MNIICVNLNRSFLKSLVPHFSRIEQLFGQTAVIYSQFYGLKHLDWGVSETFVDYVFYFWVQDTDQAIFLHFLVNFLSVNVVETESKEGAFII